ncbi:MAG: shikimate dehydrogenase [Nitrosopumilus sp.]|jgi:shikimate dehydrogenase|nr:shikimate dehydrogenase [Nitrosopumilus sp.]MDH3502143.1 shikimate dehydrogenase [Nitrosopumilus sp.]
MSTYAVIGDPIDHSLSPNLHTAAFRELNLDHSYIAYRIPKDELEEGIESLKKIKIAGFNVTIPHKVTMMKFLDKMDETCSIIGAVNTVSNNNGVLKGYNTDMEGFLDPIKKRDKIIKDCKVLLLGAGGAARAIVAGFAKEHAKSITIANRTLENAKALSEFSQKIGLDSRFIRIDNVGESAKDYDIIVNATSAGLKNEPSPISLDRINRRTMVYDIVYMPMNTDFLEKAKEKGATIIYGYEMLLGQAARAFEIWHGVKAPYNAMKKALVGGA